MTPLRKLMLALSSVLVLALGACGGGGDSDSDPTAQPDATSTVAGSFSGSLATDGICVITIPDDWIDDGTGKGDTVQGDDWLLFGGNVATDDSWTAAKDLLKAQFEGQDGVTIDDTGDQITVTLPNGRGMYVRERFDQRYCEFSVTSTRDNDTTVTDIWQQVAATLAVPE